MNQWFKSVITSMVVVAMGVSVSGDETEGGSSSKEIIKVALIGDSTVTDAAGWGKAFAEAFDSSVVVSNHAAGGRSAKSWLAENRLPAVLEERPDIAFIQFGHNGQPGKGPKRETDPKTTYPEYLKQYVDALRKIGAQPVIVSSVTRRDFAGSDRIRTDVDAPVPKGATASRPLKPWAEAAAAFAKKEGVPFIDLYGKSVELHNQLGPEKSNAFNPKDGDMTHFNMEGAIAIAALVIDELKRLDHGLVEHLKTASE